MKREALQALLRVHDKSLRRRYKNYLAHFRAVVGYETSIALPHRHHEKMLWRKLFDHGPRMATSCDRLTTRAFVAARDPGFAQPELLWTGDSRDAIPKKTLSVPVVFKCNHG